MYRNSYQAGKSLEILTTQTLDKWKCTGTVKQAYDKSALGYVVNVDTHTNGVMQVPKSDKSTLGIVMPFVVLQVYLPSSKQFQCEFRISDNTSTKRRVIFTPGTKTIVKNQLHARIPSAIFRREVWLNLSLNVKEFFEHCFPDSEFKCIDSISLSGQCKIRKVFCMNSPIVDTSQLDDESGLIPEAESWDKGTEPVPKANEYKFGVNFMNQLINMSKIDSYLGSTLDDSVMAESAGDDATSKKSGITNSKKSKLRVGSGNTQLKHKKGLLRNSKNEDLVDENSNLGGVRRSQKEKSTNKMRNRTKYGSTSPFPQNNGRDRRGKNVARDEKSTDADEDSKTWGLKGKGVDKRNSTKATNNTNSENGDSSWVVAKGSISSNEKSKRNPKLVNRENSMLSKKQKQIKESKTATLKQKGNIIL